MSLLRRASSHLLVVDVQERLLLAIPGAEATLAAVLRLVAIARALDVGLTLTEHHPAGLGPTPAVLRDLVPTEDIMEKIHFSCVQEPAIGERFRALRAGGVEQVVLCGLETHVCVLQSAIALKEMGFEPFIAADASGARSAASAELGLRRAAAEGVAIVNDDMIAFEWLERAGTAQFRSILPLIKG